MAKWKDGSSYSRGDKERIPNVWKINFGRIVKSEVTEIVEVYSPD